MGATLSPVEREGEDIVLGLNRSERTYLALEGVGGSMAQVYAMRFTTQHTADEVKRAFREMVRAHPRFRSVIDRTLFGHRLRIRAEGPTIDALVDVAFQVWEHEDTSEEAIARNLSILVNEPFAVERDLPIRARFLPHPTRPVLIMNLNHIAGDGRTYLGAIQDLIKVLDGQTLETVKVDPAGYDAALIPRSPGAFLKALWAALVALFTTKKDRRPVLRLTHRWVDGFSPGTMQPLRLSAGSKQLLQASRARGTTVNSLVFAALALAMRRVNPDAPPGPVRGRLSIDLRHLFPKGREPQDGNYVSSFFVDVDPDADFDKMLPILDARTKAWIQRFTDRNMFLVGWLNEVSMWLGRKQFSRLGLWAKNHDRLPQISFHFSNVGRMDVLNSLGPKLDGLFACLPHNSLFLGLIGLGDTLYMSASFPAAEVSRAQVESLLEEMDRVLVEVVARDTAKAAAAAAAPAPQQAAAE